MKAYCTPCSAAKNHDPGEVAVSERYLSSRIDAVRMSATEDGVLFLILSGRFGLLSASDMVPMYDHLLQPAEVAALASRVSTRLRELAIDDLVFFARPADADPGGVSYRQTIVRACDLADVCLEEREV